MRSTHLAAVLCCLGLVVSGCTRAPSSSDSPSTGLTTSSSASGSATSPSPTPSPTTSTPKPKPLKRVHVSMLENDGASYGVGMPIIAWFNVRPTDATAFAAATTVTANGAPVVGGWYFEPTAHTGAALEGHWRPKEYWPAHAQIHVDLPVSDISAGKGMVFDNSLTLDFQTTASHIVSVDAKTLRLTVVNDGANWGTFLVSLGAANTPTLRGTKVIMEKGRDISMRGPGYYDAHVLYTQRLTYGGEYLHAAPWNDHLGQYSSSNGCTNLSTTDAKKLYEFLGIGDVVLYPNASGPPMTLGAGYGDWTIPWASWQSGGALKV